MERQPRVGTDLRGLKALVGFMGVLIILGTAVVIGVVIHRIYAKPAAPSMTAVVPGVSDGVPPALPPAANVLAQGEHISGIAGAGGDVAVWVGGPDGDRVLLVDPATGRVTVAIAAAK